MRALGGVGGISGLQVQVVHGMADLPGPAAVLEFTDAFTGALWRSPLLDVLLAVEDLGE